MSSREQEFSKQQGGVVEEERIREPRVGWVVAVGEGGAVQVDYPGNARGSLPARVSASLDGATLAAAAEQRQQALLMFENGDPTLPILLTLLAVPSATPHIDAVLEGTLSETPEQVVVDGERLVLRGHEEIVLECGRASLTLRRDGKVVLRGTDLVTVASGTQRIKGGKVQIN
ncbi:DUF6484 domain-containing protein [Myxococcus stipitatus]|uniref:DUF6484 domain-containing protein n=1 Tax=Myxococcus stipitatus TaxID=83455 RepID=UPI0031455A8B